MADLFVNNQTQDLFPHQNQSSSSDRPPSRDQRRQETTSSYTFMDNGTTPDFETLFNEQAESRGGSGHGNSTGVSGMWGLGGYDSQSPIGGNAHQMQLSAGQQVQHQPSQPQSIGANQKPSPFASSQVHGMPLSAPAQSRRLSGTGSLPRDRRRSSDYAEGTNVGTASLAGTVSARKCHSATFLKFVCRPNPSRINNSRKPSNNIAMQIICQCSNSKCISFCKQLPRKRIHGS